MRNRQHSNHTCPEEYKEYTYCDHLRSHKTHSSFPILRRVVEDVVHSESLVVLGELIEVLAEQDIFRVDISEDQVDLRLVTGSATPDHSPDNLQHGSDSGSSRDHAKMANHIWAVDHGSLRTSDFDTLSHDQGRHVFRDVAGGVRLDQEIEEPWLVVSRDGGIGSHNLLRVAIGLK